MGQLGKLVQGLEHAGRGLGVDGGQQLHLRLLLQDGLDGVGVGGLPPLDGDGHNRRALPGCDLLEAEPKETVLDDHCDVAGLEQVGEGGLHAGGAGAGDGKGERLLRAENLTQHLGDAVHDLDELRVQVAQDGGGHGAQDARVYVAWAGTQKDTPRRIELLNGTGGHGTPQYG